MSSNTDMKAHVLVLGCGLVAPPMIHYLAQHGFKQTIASRTQEKTMSVIAGLPGCTAVEFDIEAPNALGQLEPLIQQCDLVVSLLPYIHHVAAARIAIKHRKHFCTTSYVSAEMESLATAASDAGVLLLNECGVDPGLDHMSAQKIIDEVHSKGGKIRTFYSVCGGLPAPSADNNPLRYKLSWSPRGVLLASRNDAVYLENGVKVTVPGKDLYDEKIHRVDEFPEHGIGNLEWYPNRDSVKYSDIYGMPEVQTIIRGTYRYAGWCRSMLKFANIGLTSTESVDIGGLSYAELSARVFGVAVTSDSGALRQAVADKIQLPVQDPTMHKLDWLGMFSSDVRVPAKVHTVLDAFCALWEQKMQYAAGEKDMIVMKHTFEVEYSACEREVITSTLLDFGQQPNGFSSMARTVTLPVAVAIRALFEGRIKARGLVRPVIPELYNIILAEMEQLGVRFVERREPTHLWLRSEVKPGEERVILVPADVSKLIAAGYKVSVERSPHRVIPDDLYVNAGAQLVPTGSWTTAPWSAIILGLKELPEADSALSHRHVYFAHCYKGQAGWQQLLSRFVKGRGLLWDLEFLVDDAGRRVAAFGRPAGIAGMAVGFIAWACKQQGIPVPTPLKSWKSVNLMIEDVKHQLAAATSKTGKPAPTVLVIGALGRCGGGAAWFASQCGVKAIEWDIAETSGGGPFPQLLDVDIVVNAIYLSSKIPPFLTLEMLQAAPSNARLSVLVDVSCDASNPNNPFPIYSQITTLFDPVLSVSAGAGKPTVDVVAIDHLPSLMPLESSEQFSHDILPHVLTLARPRDSAVWSRAEQLFQQKAQLVRAQAQ